MNNDKIKKIRKNFNKRFRKMEKLNLKKIFHNISQENKIKLVMGQKIYQSLK